MSVLSPLIVALDYASAREADAFVEGLHPGSCRLKIGKELFTREGPQYVRALQGRGHDIFLDLKFHDIPKTVASAVAAAAELGVWMVNVHASGGRRMLEAASELLAKGGYDTLLTGVTVLTSMERADLLDIGLDIDPMQQVERLARLAADAGLHGVVCSAREATMLRGCLPRDFRLVTPGIRPANAPADDQRRTMTPAEALAAGVDYLVMGRPLQQHAEPMQLINEINALVPTGIAG